ncbi:unnamed protein product [Clonostachys chloroleuca]|uniref:Uncharacterized protein n=1 Tax=Clonostachys chloroleuca TaxID=1926264 RepID=A0AA35LPX9_9HYPO|nr:unnamed protein product [Clonostachys chloroleuca]
MSFVGKIYVVTGAGSGIGRATVKKLLEQGATVHALDITKIPVHENTSGQQISHENVDISSRDSVKAALNEIGRAKNDKLWLDGLVNCAGVLRTTAYSTSPQEDKVFELLWKVNVMGAWHVTTEFHARLQRLRQSDGPQYAKATTSIVNVGSMASVRGIPGMAAYVASKHAVHGLTKTLAQDLGPSGYRVNTVAPGAVNTPMIATELRDGAHETDKAFRGAFKTFSEPEEIADTILFLLGDGSSSISGQLLELQNPYKNLNGTVEGIIKNDFVSIRNVCAVENDICVYGEFESLTGC